MEKLRETLRVRKERAILVAAIQPGRSDGDDLAELKALAESAGAVVVDRFQQKIRTINPARYIGKGKAEQLKGRVKKFRADVVIFDNDLSPRQIRELEEIIEVKVLDRSELILDIFATRAKTRQAKLQVELAQLEYTYTLILRFEQQRSRQLIARQKFFVFTFLLYLLQLLAVITPHPHCHSERSRGISFLTEQYSQNGTHRTIADYGNILEHRVRLKQPITGIATTIYRAFPVPTFQERISISAPSLFNPANWFRPSLASIKTELSEYCSFKICPFARRKLCSLPFD